MDWEIMFRLANAVGCGFALWILALDGWRFRKSWNIKTQDHWLALSVWVLVGAVGAIEAIYRKLDVGPTTVIKLLAVALTLRALLRKGSITTERTKAPWKKEE